MKKLLFGLLLLASCSEGKGGVVSTFTIRRAEDVELGVICYANSNGYGDSLFCFKKSDLKVKPTKETK